METDTGRKHAAISKSHSAPRTVSEKMNIPNSQVVRQQSTLLFCLQEQNCTDMAEKYSYLCRTEISEFGFIPIPSETNTLIHFHLDIPDLEPRSLA